MPRTLTPTAYAALFEQITEILAEGKIQTRQATEWERVETYWHVGDAIYVSVLDRRDRAEYGQGIVPKLANDLNLGESLLHDIVRFRKAFMILSTYRELTWSHYRVLIRLPTVDQRHFYERTANRGRWPVRRLQDEIHSDLFQQTKSRPEALPPGEDPFGGRPLRASRGKLYTYTTKGASRLPRPNRRSPP